MGQTSKRRYRSGPDNHLWKGGRSIASNGYVLIRVGISHHLADVRGYAYEHRLNAERKIGRRLEPGELVHHINENRQDNRDDNLKVCDGNAEHFVHHRLQNSSLQLPRESNPIIACRCGCGGQFPKFDDAGRPRKYITGHNPQPAPTMIRIAAELAIGPRKKSQLAAEIGTSPGTIAALLSKMKSRGLVTNLGRAVWALRQ